VHTYSGWDLYDVHLNNALFSQLIRQSGNGSFLTPFSAFHCRTNTRKVERPGIEAEQA
jgi:hypothetical protein